MPQPRNVLPRRSQEKRDAILAAGQELFLSGGYRGTSVDQIAASAAVSKQTVYQHFDGKRELLFAIVTEAIDTTVLPFLDRISGLTGTDDLEADLLSLGRDYLRAVLQERLVQLRRLVIAEANRLPELAKLYYDAAPTRTLTTLADAFRRLDEKKLLNAPEPNWAAQHFAFLVIGQAIDKALFCGGPEVLADIDLDARVRAAVDVFLAGYRPKAQTSR